MGKQTIFSRVSQLVRANINDLIDQAEDPEKLIDQLVRDYSNAIHEATEAVAVSVGALRLKQDDEREAREAAVEWGTKAKTASRRADDETDEAEQTRFNDLAKIALKKQISFENQATLLQQSIEADERVVNELKDGLRKMEDRLETLRSKRQELVSRSKMVKAQEQVQSAIGSVSASDPTSDLARFEDRIRQREARVRGRNELAAESLDEQFAGLDADAADLEAEQRLAALKEKTPV